MRGLATQRRETARRINYRLRGCRYEIGEALRESRAARVAADLDVELETALVAIDTACSIIRPLAKEPAA